MSNYERALGFAQCAHRQQRRKYTDEPYITHCQSVAELIQEVIGPDDEAMLCAAALHDTVEDTAVTLGEIASAFGTDVAGLVSEVTDASRPEDGNRARRKQIDREHLAKSSSRGASIKLSDLIDNTSSIVKYDPDFARIYLREKMLLLPVLKHGHPELWALAESTLEEAKKVLGMWN
jgi:(p)ppGpp synthase/HD superfamily hydrolase